MPARGFDTSNLCHKEEDLAAGALQSISIAYKDNSQQRKDFKTLNQINIGLKIRPHNCTRCWDKVPDGGYGDVDMPRTFGQVYLVDTPEYALVLRNKSWRVCSTIRARHCSSAPQTLDAIDGHETGLNLALTMTTSGRVPKVFSN